MQLTTFDLSEIYRYLLNFTAKDETGEASFFAYDEIAKLIVQKDRGLIINPLKLASGLPQPLQSIISKKFTFSVGLTEDSFTTRARRQYLVNHILDRSDRRNSALNIAASGKPAETVPAPATTSTQPPSSLQITPWATTSATSSSDYPRQSISMLKLFPLIIHNFLYIYIPW